MTSGLLADEPVADGVHGADVEAASAAEAVGWEHITSNPAFSGIEGTSSDTGLAFGAAAAVDLYPKDTHSFKKPTQQAEGADELTERSVEA